MYNYYHSSSYMCVCSIARQLIYNYPEQLFADAGVMAIEHADFEGIERLALVLGEWNGNEDCREDNAGPLL